MTVRDRILRLFAILNGRGVLEEGPMPSMADKMSARTMPDPRQDTSGGGSSRITKKKPERKKEKTAKGQGKVFVKNVKSGNVYAVGAESARKGIASGMYTKPSDREVVQSKRDKKTQAPAAEREPTAAPEQQPQDEKPRQPTTPRGKVSASMAAGMEEVKGNVGKGLTPNKTLGDNSSMKPDAIAKSSKFIREFNPMESDVILGDDNYTKAVLKQLKQGRNLLAYSDSKGDMVRADSPVNQMYYMTRNLGSLIESLKDPSKWENEGTYAGAAHFAEQFGSILGSLSEDATSEQRTAAADQMFQAYATALKMSNEDQWSNSLFKNFGEFFEHNFELMKGEENYLPSAGNFEVGDKVRVFRDGQGQILRLEHGSFKSDKSAVKDSKIRFGGAAPSVRGEVFAVTFFGEDEEKDTKIKQDLYTLYSHKTMDGEDHLKAMVSLVKKNFGSKAAKQVLDTRAEVLANNEFKFADKLKEIDDYIKACKHPDSKKNLRFFQDKLNRHITNYSSTEAVFNRAESADFATEIMVFNRNKNELSRGERVGVDKYSRHSKFSTVKLKKMGATCEDLADPKKAAKFFDIQGTNALPHYNTKITDYAKG